MRREDVGDGSAAEGRAADRLYGERHVEEPLARAQDDRMHDEAIFVDQAGRNERPREPVPPCASRYPPERSCLSRATPSARSPAAIVVSLCPGRSEFEGTTPGNSETNRLPDQSSDCLS